jgi:HlyD family secretion protein
MRSTFPRIRMSFGVRIAAAAITALLLGPGPGAPGAQATKPALPPKPALPSTEKAARAPFRIEVELSGVFEARRAEEIFLSPEVWTQLRVLRAVEHGAAVEKGQRLVWLDMKKIDKALRDREAARPLAELALAQGVEGLRHLEKTTPDQLAQLDRTLQRTEEDFARHTKVEGPLAAKASTNTLKYRADVLAYSREELRQLKKMYEADDLTEETEEIVLKRQKDAVGRAEFALERAKVDHERKIRIDLPRQAEDLLLGRQRAREHHQNQRTLLPLALKKKRLEVAKMKRDDARSVESLAKLKADRQAMMVTAPTAGVVYYGRCVRGQWTTAKTVAAKLVRGGTLVPDEVFLTVVDPKALRVRAAAAEKDLHRLREGLKGTAAPAGYPDRKLKVTLAAISTVPISPGQFDAMLEVGGEAGPVMPGMTCKVRLVAYENAEAIALPASAVFTEPGEGAKRFVYVRKDGAARKRPVQVGRTHRGKTEILDGLDEGETVLLKAPR